MCGGTRPEEKRSRCLCTSASGIRSIAPGHQLSVRTRTLGAPGDSTGVGSRQVGYGVGVEVAASSPTNVSAGAWYAVGIARLNVQYSGDTATPAAGLDPSRSIGGGVIVPLYGNIALTLHGVAGLASGSPSWSFTLGVRVTPAGVAEAAVAPQTRAGRAFGRGRRLRGSTGSNARGKGKRSVP